MLKEIGQPLYEEQLQKLIIGNPNPVEEDESLRDIVKLVGRDPKDICFVLSLRTSVLRARVVSSLVSKTNYATSK